MCEQELVDGKELHTIQAVPLHLQVPVQKSTTSTSKPKYYAQTTTDRDFEHLDGVWFGVNYVEAV